MDLGLKGKVAFVACSSKGLGKSCAMELAREGASVMVTGRNEADLQQAVREITDLNAGAANYVVCDIMDPVQIKQAIARTVELFGTIHILINNAGGPPSGGFEQFNDEAWESAFQLTLLSYVRLIREALPFMKEQGEGRILNLTSTSVKQPIPNLLLSNTFRVAVAGLSKSLSAELAAHGILVHTIAPGRIYTDRVKYLDGLKAEATGISIEEVEKQSKSTIPLGRYGEPSEFGKVVAIAASSATSYMTGTTIVVDGGMIRGL